jgi:hypothetical protein
LPLALGPALFLPVRLELKLFFILGMDDFLTALLLEIFLLAGTVVDSWTWLESPITF